MAKATKAPEKKTAKAPAKKAAAKAAPAKAAASRSPVKAAPAKAKAAPAKAVPAKAAPKASSSKSSSSADKGAPSLPPPPKALPAKDARDVFTPRAHEDAKLSKAELTTLYNALIEEKNRVLNNFEMHVDDALADEDLLADEMDIAQRSTDQAASFRVADKDRKLLIEIDSALDKLRSGEYGLCEGTDEPIGYKRLEIRPWTRYSVEYKEQLEREKAQQAR